MSLRLGFLGTGDFAVPSLRVLHAAGHRLGLVVCQPDRPKGRGHQLQAPALKRAAEALGLPVWQPERMRDAESIEAFMRADLDLACVVAYGQILPQAVLDAPRLGCVNVHASLLPRWRGAAPIEWAVAAGDASIGVCVQRMAYKLDAGDVLDQWERPLRDEDDAPALHAELAQRGAQLLARCVAAMERGPLEGRKQDEAAVTLAPLLKRSDGYLDPRWTRRKILNRFRAFKQRPGTALAGPAGERLKVLGLRDAGAGAAEPGSVTAVQDGALRLACADGELWLERLQAPSGKPMGAADYARGRHFGVGARFAAPQDGSEGDA